MFQKPLTSDVIQRAKNFVDKEASSYAWRTGWHRWSGNKQGLLHEKLAQWRNRIVLNCSYDILLGIDKVSELKIKLARATEIIEFLESVGIDQTKHKGNMDRLFGLYLMRSPEVKRWD